VGASADLARWVEGLVEGRRGDLVQRKRERSVWCVQDDDGRVWYAKRGTGSKRREVVREAESTRFMESRGLGPKVLASGTYGGAAWLVTEHAEGQALGWALHTADARGRRAVLRALAATVRSMHEGGIACPDLSVVHTWVHDGGVRFIDFARLERRSGPVSVTTRARDLASLVFGLPRFTVPRTVRVRFLADATGARGAALRDVCRRVDRELERLALRTRWRHRAADWRPEFLRDHVKAHGAAGVVYPDALFDAAGMTVVRTLPDRENRTLGRGPDGRPAWFVKVFPPTRRGWSPAMREVAAIDLFERCGVPVNRLAAFCEDLDRGSLVAVAGCAGEPLDDFLRRGVPRAERRALALQTARIWRRMRACGLRHRDAYACHAFVARTPDPRRHEIRLIDLTRAGLAPWPRERWFVKDAAQLWHGASPAGATATDAVAWLRAYFGVPRLTREAKRFARKVAAKESAIAARQARKAAHR
jgi:tRNA A-37 threonylcarbamoyl transferase component Bud32